MPCHQSWLVSCVRKALISQELLDAFERLGVVRDLRQRVVEGVLVRQWRRCSITTISTATLNPGRNDTHFAFPFPFPLLPLPLPLPSENTLPHCSFCLSLDELACVTRARSDGVGEAHFRPMWSNIRELGMSFPQMGHVTMGSSSCFRSTSQNEFTRLLQYCTTQSRPGERVTYLETLKQWPSAISVSWELGGFSSCGR